MSRTTKAGSAGGAGSGGSAWVVLGDALTAPDVGVTVVGGSNRRGSVR
jgi:hypothetical protein